LPTGKEIKNFIFSQSITLIVLLIAWISGVVNNMGAKIVLSVCIPIFIGALVAWIIYLFTFHSNREFNNLIERYNARVQECQTHTNSLQKYCRYIELKENLLKLILDKQDISDLEKRVPNDTEIIVMTSKFVLEKKAFMSIIVNNIRKGVMYNYLIPSDDRNTTDYFKTAVIWWDDFKTMFTQKERCSELLERPAPKEIVFSRGFMDLLSRCKKFHEMQKDDQDYEEIKEALKNDIFDYFKGKIRAYKIDEKYSFITIIMYQKEANSINYDVIIKLPTSDNNEEYTAYLVPDKNEKPNLVQSIRRFCDVHRGAERYDIFSQHKADFKW